MSGNVKQPMCMSGVELSVFRIRIWAASLHAIDLGMGIKVNPSTISAGRTQVDNSVDNHLDMA